MSGTDHSKTPDWGGPSPAIILVRPQMGENIGAAARGMWNFGLDRMRLVAPRDGWPNQAAIAMASGAGQVLDQVQLVERTEDAVADLTYVYATTARDRDLTKEVMTPEQAMLDARARIQAGGKVGILFGPERAGLENADVALASSLISVPVNPAFGSLNLAQCVLLLAYEWVRAGSAAKPAEPRKQDVPATRVEVERLCDRLEEDLAEKGFFYPEDKGPSMRLNLRNLFSRLELTQADTRILHGVVRALSGKKQHHD